MRAENGGEAGAERGHDLGRVVHRQGGLGDEGQVVRVARLKRHGVFEGLDQHDGAGWELAQGAVDLRMARVADQHDLAASLEMPLGVQVHLGYQRAGGVQI